MNAPTGAADASLCLAGRHPGVRSRLGDSARSHLADSARSHNAPFVEVRLVNAINGEEVFRDHMRSVRLAGDIVSKANITHWTRLFFSIRQWEYILVDSSAGRKPLIELLQPGEKILILMVVKVPFHATAVEDEVAATPLGDVEIGDVEIDR